MNPLRAVGWSLVLLLALAMAGYSFVVFFLRDPMYVDIARESFRARPWGILPHACFGAIALALGPFQFLAASWRRRPALHRSLGIVCVVSMLVTGASGLYMAAYAYGGWGPQSGFGGMALLMLICPIVALRRLKRHNLYAHRAWMIRAYAVLFSAVSFRLWLPLFASASTEFVPAYGAAAWLSWVGNLIWAEVFIRRSGPFRAPAARSQ